MFAGSTDQAWYWALPLTLGKTLVLFVGLLLASRWLLPRLFHEVAASHSAELFVLLALVIVLLTAWLTHLLGLSPALGAFLAGMLLGESHYRHQIEADIRPFRDILLGLFFVSIGMLIDLQLFAHHGLLILGLTLALLLIKGTVVAILVRGRGSDVETAWRSGLALAQGGEFCFALMAQMQQNQLMPAQISGPLLAATFCSMVMTPLLLRAAPRIATGLHRKPNQEAHLEEISALNAELHGHVVICGYGRVGQSIGRFLRREQQRFVALDDDPVRVREAAAGESCVHYGDSRRGDLLSAVGLERARLLVVAVDKTDIALLILKEARRLSATVPILVRTRDDSQLAELKEAGANEVVPELLESSLMLASHALIMLGVEEQRVQAGVNEVRHSRYKLLRGFYHGAQTNLLGSQGQPKVLMHAVNLVADAHACGRSLNTLALEQLGVEIQGQGVRCVPETPCGCPGHWPPSRPAKHDCSVASGRCGPQVSVLAYGADLVNRQVGPVILFLLAQPQAIHRLDQPIHRKTADQRHDHAQRRTNQLADQADAAQATQRLLTEDAAGDPAPYMQRPDTQHVVDLPFALGGDKAPDKQATRHRAGHQRPDRMHQVGAGTDRHQPGQGTVMQEPRIVATDDQCRHRTADHGHQRVHRHQATDALQGLCAHHVEAEPADNQNPRTQRQKRNARRSERHQPPFAVATLAWPQQPGRNCHSRPYLRKTGRRRRRSAPWRTIAGRTWHAQRSLRK